MGSSVDQDYTGKHDQNGAVFPVGQDGTLRLVGGFIDYVMRMAGAGRRFPYSPNHSDYINAARQRSTATPNLAITAPSGRSATRRSAAI